MEIFFVRHGLTQSNIEKRLMGARINDPLSPQGHEQAQNVAQQINRDFNILFSSPLLRAYQTAEYFAQVLKLPIHVREELKERDCGILSGCSWDEVAIKTNGELTYEKLKAHEELNYSKYGGETTAIVLARLEKFLAEIIKLYADKKVLIVSHGGIIRLMYRHFKKGEMPPELGNLSLHKFII